MSERKVQKVYAFSSGASGGNPAGVVIEADGLSEKQMQAMAQAAGFSETAFVSKSDKAGFKLDFFTPNRRIPDCGHATVAAFSVLKDQFPQLSETSKEIVNGVRNILIKDGRVYMEQPLAKIERVPDVETMSSSLFSKDPGIISAWLIRHDVGFLIAEVDNEAHLENLVPKLDAIKEYSEQNDLVGVYLFVRKKSQDVIATTRMFAPAYGIDEESATGMAAGLLSKLFYDEGCANRFVIEQGKYMTPPSPSLIYCELEPDRKRVLVGGSARIEH